MLKYTIFLNVKPGIHLLGCILKMGEILSQNITFHPVLRQSYVVIVKKAHP